MAETPPSVSPSENYSAAPSGPVMDVVAPPPVPKATAPAPAAPAKPLPAPTQKPAKPPAKTGVTAAIFATVIIVLGLAALAVYAFLKSR